MHLVPVYAGQLSCVYFEYQRLTGQGWLHLAARDATGKPPWLQGACGRAYRGHPRRVLKRGSPGNTMSQGLIATWQSSWLTYDIVHSHERDNGSHNNLYNYRDITDKSLKDCLCSMMNTNGDRTKWYGQNGMDKMVATFVDSNSTE